MAIFTGNKVMENEPAAAKMLKERGFGEEVGERLLLAPVEALYLVEKKRISVLDGKKRMAFDSLFLAFKKAEKELDMKYAVYRDLRSKGYVVRTGLKYGTYFRVYDKGIRVGEGHSELLVQPVPEEMKTSVYEIAGAIRISHSVKKKMIWAIVDTEGDVTYIKLSRIVP
ncbi:tRNA-splicing endonuclease [uncultured archaeon]|nr:tRNA-splicing endonuclease [uncultured archaeon]